MQRTMKPRAASLLALAALAAGSYTCAARATVFEHKWIAGQRLSYDLSLSDSHLNLAGSANAPMLPMGIPLNIDMTGDGAVDLDTQSVAEDGTGIVAVRVPKFQINAAVMMMNAVMKMQDGKGHFLLNGKEMGDAKGFDVSAMTSPQMALKIGKGGDVLGFVPLAGAASTRTTKTEKSPFPFDMQAMMQGAMMNVMPQLWPARDIKAGESWSVEPKFALPGQTAPATLGKIALKLVGDENLDGRAVQRVTIQGEMNLNKEMAQALAKARPDGLNNGSLDRVKQVVNGDIWFDAAAGQMVRTVMKVHLQSEGSGTRRAAADDDAAPKKWSSTQEFEGTLRMDLRGVSTVPVAAAVAPATTPTAPASTREGASAAPKM